MRYIRLKTLNEVFGCTNDVPSNSTSITSRLNVTTAILSTIITNVAADSGALNYSLALYSHAGENSLPCEVDSRHRCLYLSFPVPALQLEYCPGRLGPHSEIDAIDEQRQSGGSREASQTGRSRSFNPRAGMGDFGRDQSSPEEI